MKKTHPNVVVVFADQWRAQATGYAGDPNLAGHTPRLDALAAESMNFCHAVAGCPVCTPYRASLLTGQYPHRHGLFLNDLPLETPGPRMGEAFARAGYDTAYIGKWHVDGDDRGGFIPRERRAGFDFWEVLECGHNYNNSWYWGNDDRLHRWEGYDAIDQTRHACRYMREHAGSDRPFLLTLSWGPPHAPYQTAPQEYRDRFDPAKVRLHPNVPPESEAQAREELAGYYAHIACLDDCLGELLDTLDESGLAGETIFLFTSDHGDMLGCHGRHKKQQPWEESLRVPFLLRDGREGDGGRTCEMPIDAPDILPTLLGLAGVEAPEGIDGLNAAPAIREGKAVGDGAALLACYSPFGQWNRSVGGREYRGLRTERYTYARTLEGPWLLYDNRSDPYQLNNLVDDPACAELLRGLDEQLCGRLAALEDDFPPGPQLIRRWGYDTRFKWTDRETVAFSMFHPPKEARGQ